MKYKVPKEFLYSKEHEWIKINDETALTGVTDYAQHKLGEITYVEFTRRVNDQLKQFEEYAIINTQKSSEPVYSPASGLIEELNESILEDPTVIHEDPYGSGWFARLRLQSFEEERANLMSSEEYKEYIKKLEETSQ